jgi:hypothetical protein
MILITTSMILITQIPMTLIMLMTLTLIYIHLILTMTKLTMNLLTLIHIHLFPIHPLYLLIRITSLSLTHPMKLIKPLKLIMKQLLLKTPTSQDPSETNMFLLI